MKGILHGLFISLILFGCTVQEEPVRPDSEHTETTSEIAVTASESTGVVAVEAVVNDSGYTFAVTIQSSDEGCDQYANWWEVITEEGDLIYRRLLAHSHVDEQPFTRSGGPVEIAPEEVVIVRSHMHPTGYQPQAMQGSFTTGFTTITLPTDFATELTEVEPLPTGCAF